MTRFDTYRFSLEGEPYAGDDSGGAESAQLVRELAADTAEQRVQFAGLVAGRLYNVTMSTVSRGVASHPVRRQARLFPRAARNLRAASVGARDVELRWEPPGGAYTDFEVQFVRGENELQLRATPEPRLLVTGLRPHTHYTFSVEVRAGSPAALLTRSAAVSLDVTTRQAPPEEPDMFQPADARPSELALTWSLAPDRRNGDLRRYVVRYWPARAPSDVRERNFPADAVGGTVSQLLPGETYVFRLHAETDAGSGPPRWWRQRMAIEAPPPPLRDALPAEVARTASTVSVRFRGDYFSSDNGNVTAYTLVVAEDPSLNASRPALPSWRDVQHYSVWPPYQVTEPYFPFDARTVEEFTIGSDRCERAGSVYCNGPLKPGTSYRVKLRAFTAPDKFTDTEYAAVRTEPDRAAWVAGASSVAALLAAAAGAALLWRRRRSRGRPRAEAVPLPPAPRSSRPVPVDRFPEHYRIMSADSDFRFSEEFEELKPVGREQPCSAADLPVNRPKNRFTNILPYDHSRYKLQPVDDEEGSDYINANFVPGYGSPREFIVTQGPLHSTRDDFWRMCWESGSRAVVMLTRCVEKGREKCDRYWPTDTRPTYYGDIAVTTLNESHFPDWTVSEFLLSRGAEQRALKHFHFTTWPDFGVPSPATTLARFVRAFRERSPPDRRPVVVHCSAGVGRSGTFITLDTALQQLATGAPALDVFGLVHALRRERVWMVQTEQQYICIHQCLVAAIEGQDLAPPAPHHLNPAFEDDEGIAESGM